MLINNNEYFEVLENIKSQIHAAQYKAVLGANQEQIILYWNIGKVIIDNSQWEINSLIIWREILSWTSPVPQDIRLAI